MTKPKRVLVLSFDAASPELIRRWCADGSLPNIARVFSEGLVADTASMEGMEVGATWTSFYTGLNPAGHGICWINRVIPGTYREQRLTVGALAGLPVFWERLSRAGKRVAIMDVPFQPRMQALPGVQVANWGVHDAADELWTAPRRLKRRVRRQFGDHPAPPTCDTDRLDPAGYRDLCAKTVQGIELRGQMTRDLLGETEWDFGLQVFNEVHCAGHMFWHYHDPSHPAHDPETVARDGDLLKEVYVATDREIGRIIEAVGPETTVMLMCMHGMEHTCGSSLLLPHILERLGVLTRASAPPATAEGVPDAPRPRTPGLRGLVKRLVPEAIRLPIYEFRQWVNTRWLRRGSPIDIDPSRTKAFQMGFGAGSTYSGIRLNIVGREPEGTLHRGKEVDEFVEELREALMEVVDPETGRPLVQRLVRTGDLHQGPRLDDLPDLMVQWSYDRGRGNTKLADGTGGVWRGYSERIGHVEHPNGSGRSGAHRLGGIMAMMGPTTRPGRLDRVVLATDFAPTILAMFGVGFEGGDGRVVSELLG